VLSVLMQAIVPPEVPLFVPCARCGQRLRFNTGVWASNGLPVAWAFCGECQHRPGQPIVMCPRGHKREVTDQEHGVSNSDNPKNANASNLLQACRTGRCARDTTSCWRLLLCLRIIPCPGRPS
jgi:hypothetical protein